jgi:uncharacterized phage protein (TIGR01671 family)
MREIKFRAWRNEDDPRMINWNTILRVGFQRFIDVDNYILMQYTGLKDKNGKEIYEGDILQIIHDVRVGTRVVTRRRQQDTFDVTESQIGQGAVEWDEHQYKAKLNLFDDYPSYFFVSSRRDRPRQIHQRITINSEKFIQAEVIGNIYENPELLK